MPKRLGKTDVIVSDQGLGCMSISEFYGVSLPDDEAIKLIQTAFANGINFFDTADVYGYGENERLIGKAISHLMESGVQRSAIVLASKCGIVRDKDDVTRRGVNNSYAYVKECCERSLSRLGISVRYIDLYYLHRIADHGAHESGLRAATELLNSLTFIKIPQL